MTQDSTNRIKKDLQILAVRLERYLRLEAADRLTVIATVSIISAVAFALAVCALFFICLGLVKTINDIVGDEAVSYYIVGSVLLLLIGVVMALRRPLVESRCVKYFSRMLLSDTTLSERFAAKQAEDEQLRRLAETLVREMDEEQKGGGK